MPDSFFFANNSDVNRIADFVLNSQGFLILNEFFYESEKYIEIKTFDQFLYYRKLKKRDFFILKPTYFICPLQMHKFIRDEKEKYYVEQRVGGPCIRIILSNTFEEKKEISKGSISYYTKYLNTNSGELEKPPDELKKFYIEILKVIKKGGIVKKWAERISITMADGANQDFQNGWKYAGTSDIQEKVPPG